MTPYQLEEVVRKAKARVDNGMSTGYASYILLLALVQHAADKEAEHNLKTAEPA